MLGIYKNMNLEEIKRVLLNTRDFEADEADALVERVAELAVTAYAERLEPMDTLYLEPWAKGGDCQVWFTDEGSFAMRMEHPKGHECARYINKRDAEAIIEWLTRALERMS